MRPLIIVLLFFALTAMANPMRPLSKGKLLAPKGFDSNDPVEVVISGTLPDLCHRNPSYEIVREGQTFLIQLSAYYVPGENCERLSLPFMQRVNLGMLPAGTYEVKLMDFKKTVSRLSVKVTEASSSLQDNFNYGNVMGLREIREQGRIELIGTNPIDCLEFEYLETKVQSNVIVFLPHFREAGECHAVPKSFSIFYELPPSLDTKELLFHVRVMDGRSFNYIYYMN
jgi:hypothetical protein